ncbi:ComEC/Rec2 family competence protein [Pseudorhodobacter aquimaris]|uniref:ComEC/Rec2 family competence protein n=1 Tax=Pseudorhodobacter aquimaris TaxID=687412 RepID=UPI000A82B1F5|nr:ComEC/Rec2 family competence protein [Pseudorhodobacter aquimaris]
MDRLRALALMPVLALAHARGFLFVWVPVFIGVGVGLWFSLPQEPVFWHYACLVAAVLLGIIIHRRGPELAQPFVVVMICVILGMLAAGARAHLVNAPILGFRYYGAVEGRIVSIDRSQSDMMRLTLDRVVLERTSPSRTPERVRISLHGQQGFVALEPGQRVIATAHLSAPEGPVEPGAFDFRRMAFFDRLGAVGYTRVPVLLLEPPASGAQWVNRFRAKLRAAVEAELPGDPGAFAAALVTGDRAGMSREAQENLRAANLSHLLAISGLHMALLTGFIFATLRYGLALVPPLALRVQSKKVAAGLALLAGAAYLALSGGNVATERAFVMVAVMLGAVLFDRRALSIRSVALAACVLLLMQPETLLEPGFQMSFAATVALIAGYSALRGQGRRLPFWVAPLATVVFTSLLAGLATAPVAAAHFNRVAGYGLAANVLAVPVMGFAVMPAAVLAGVLAPLGLEGPALWVMGKGTAWILSVAEMVAGWEGAVRAVPSPPWQVLPILALGALWLVLWRGRVRFFGLAPMAFAFVLWSQTERPPLLISADGGLIGLQTSMGRVLSAPKGAGFTARQWLENDGDLADQEQTALRNGFEGEARMRRFSFGGWRLAQVKGKGAEGRVEEACLDADLIIVARKTTVPAPEGCQVIDSDKLRATGPLALWAQADGSLHAVPTKTQSRLWTSYERSAAFTLYLPNSTQ